MAYSVIVRILTEVMRIIWSLSMLICLNDVQLNLTRHEIEYDKIFLKINYTVGPSDYVVIGLLILLL